MPLKWLTAPESKHARSRSQKERKSCNWTNNSCLWFGCVSFWGNQRRMQAYPLFAVLGQTAPAERENTGAMVNIGRPGIAEQLMHDAGLDPGSRTSLRLCWEFPDVEFAARALAASGPGYLAIQHLGADAFMSAARAAADTLYVAGVGVRAEVEVQFLVGTVPS